MHHKYAVRDGEAVWTGSANWTTDSWTRQENVLLSVESKGLADAYTQNFAGAVGAAGRREERARRADGGELESGVTARAWFTPGHGPELSQAIASAIGAASRVRIASPVITSGPILGTLAEIAAAGGRDVAGIVDEPQIDAVFGQWASQLAVEDPAARKGADGAPVLGQAVDSLGPGNDSRLHARQGHGRRRRRLRRLVQPLALRREERRERARDPRPGARRANGAVRRFDPGPLPGHFSAGARDGDDLLDIVRNPEELEVGGRDPAGAEQLVANPVEQVPTSSRMPTSATGCRTASPVWVSVSSSKVSSRVPYPPGKMTNAWE